MEPPKILSGAELVARGITKLDASLPEVGLKDVVPNGSWLEQKQIQSALDARKNLIEVERIEKQGTPSHAIWRDDLMKAEVTKMAGGHWQYLGHNIGKTLYIYPEEVMFLMEVNCLLLTHNEVTVSLQKAYSLLLHSPTTLTQYRVYASLSRLGYKLLRHKGIDTILNQNTKEKQNESVVEDSTVKTKNSEPCVERNKDNIPAEEGATIISDNACIDENGCLINNPVLDNDVDKTETDERNNNAEMETVSSTVTEKEKECEITEIIENNQTMENMDGIESPKALDSEHNIQNGDTVSNVINTKANGTEMDVDNGEEKENDMEIEYIETFDNLRSSVRSQNPCDYKSLHKYFENIPELSKRQVITINVPDQEHIPKNIFVNKNTYTLDLSNIKRKTSRCESTESAYNSTDEVNGRHVRRIRANTAIETPQNANLHIRPPTSQFFFRPFPFWRQQNNINFFQFSMYFQRSTFSNMFLQSRLQFQHRPPPYLRPIYTYTPNPNLPTINPTANSQRRPQNGRSMHLQDIKQLGNRLKQLIQSGTQQNDNIASLKSLLHSYNLRYNTKLRLTENCDIVNDERIVETIELDDEEEPKSKRPRTEEDTTYDRNLNKLKQLAKSLKILETKHKSSSRHKRAFSNAIRTFNSSYNADLYLNRDFEIIDKRQITLDSSSESDCVVEETKTVRKRKKLRNPFNILKRLSQQLEVEANQNTSKSEDDTPTVKDPRFEDVTKYFDKNWLPVFNDFGRPEVVTKHYLASRILDSNKEMFIYDYIKDHFHEFNSWFEAKSSFLRHIEETDLAIRKEQSKIAQSISDDSELKPLIEFEDCTNMPTVLEKLRIIKNNKDVQSLTNLVIDFDVYNRDVQNFRKTNPPKPHFRIICLDESSNFPSVDDVASLQAKYKDEVPIVFAVASISSVSYIQLNTLELPVYVPTHDA